MEARNITWQTFPRRDILGQGLIGNVCAFLQGISVIMSRIGAASFGKLSLEDGTYSFLNLALGTILSFFVVILLESAIRHQTNGSKYSTKKPRIVCETGSGKGRQSGVSRGVIKHDRNGLVSLSPFPIVFCPLLVRKEFSHFPLGVSPFPSHFIPLIQLKVVITGLGHPAIPVLLTLPPPCPSLSWMNQSSPAHTPHRQFVSNLALSGFPPAYFQMCRRIAEQHKRA